MIVISTKEKHLLYSVCYLFVFLVSTSVALTQEEEQTPRATNLEVIQMLSRQVGDSIAQVLNSGDSLRLVVRPSESAWFVQGVIVKAMSERGRIPTQSLSSPFLVELGLVSVNVGYSNIRRTGLFGSKILDRAVRVDFNANVVNNSSGVILLNANMSRSSNDVVEVSEVSKLENSSIPTTRGVLPKEGFFSSIIEPFVAVGAIAVAVYLLFHVRS